MKARRKTHLYIGIAVCLFIILGLLKVAMAEVTTEDLIPDDTITTESEGIYIYSAPKEQAVETPNMDVEIQPAPPLLDYNNFSPEKVATLKAIELAWHIKKGLIPADAKLRFLGSKRDVSEDLQLYSMTIALHVRAINEGKDVNYYLDFIKAGKTPEEQSARLAVLKRDVELCKWGFEVYPDSNICSKWVDHRDAEQNFYHCEKENGILKAELIKVTKPAEPVCADKGWSRGNKWKAVSDTRPNQGVILLDTSYCDGKGGSLVSNLRVEDALGGIVTRPSFDICNKSNGGRMHQRFFPSGNKMQGPVFVRYDKNGVEECWKGTPKCGERWRAEARALLGWEE